MIVLNESFYRAAQATGDFPPAFGGSQFVYGAVLFMLLSISAIAMQVLLEEMDCYYRGTLPRRSPQGIHCRLEMTLMGAFIMAVAPDGVVMLAWGEINDLHIAMLSATDRMFDFMSGALFLRWWWLRARTAKILTAQLSANPDEKTPWLEPEQLKNKLVVLSMCMVLALGVAVAK